MLNQWTVDAFAAQPFGGNPACVLEPLDAWPTDTWMQALAAENNQAETAFLRRTADPARFDLRWFTPRVEVPLCGHATLASGHVLLAELGLEAQAVVFDTQSGPLTVRRAGRGYEMDFPAQPPRRIATLAGLAEALGAEPTEVWQASYLVALLQTEAQVRALRPDIARLAGIGGGAVSVAALADEGRSYDVVDRFFAPAMGIDEDPATGSLHCILTPLFAARLQLEQVRFHQAYPGRGGDLVGRLAGDRVLLGGEAVTVGETRLRLAA